MPRQAHFTPALFRFLRDLKKNNNRDWFMANKGRYERDVRDPMLRFISDFAPLLRSVAPSFTADARPVGGSLFRIYRDVRFSKDKTPYKTMAAAHFRHRSRGGAHAPGFYLHLEPGDVFGGAGLWRPDGETLGRVRDAVAAKANRYRRILAARTFRAKLVSGGDRLKRPPNGYPPDHPLIEELKRKDFVVFARYDERAACAPDFLQRFARTCRAAAPFMEFLTVAVGLPWKREPAAVR